MQACSPNRVADCLEQIQRLATSLVKGFRGLPYKERLRRQGLHSLRRRRLRGGRRVLLDLESSLFFIPAVRQGLRGHPLKVLQGPSRCLRSKGSFSTQVNKWWNRLPTPIATAPSVNSFKRQLDSVWKELFAGVGVVVVETWRLGPLEKGFPSKR